MEKEIRNKHFIEERPLFNENNLKIFDCVFSNGESPLKECKNIYLENSVFEYKYPLWYSKNIKVEKCKLDEMARAGIWYSININISNSTIVAPKTFRRSNGIILNNVDFLDAKETLWECNDIKINNSKIDNCDYFGMNSNNIELNNVTLNGNYCFDGACNIIIRNCVLNSKDAFWNTKNVTVYNSVINGEYIGWNSINLKFVNCKIQSVQGFCYINNLELDNCDLTGTTLAFEYSSVKANIINIDSILNPNEGYIKVNTIEELIMDNTKINPSKTVIECDNIKTKSDRFTVIRR